MIEEWRDIPGYEGLYQASNLGRIRSLDRMQRLWHGGHRLQAGRVLKAAPNSWNYHMVTLHNNGQKVWAVHILVMLTFEGPCPEGLEVCHGDGNKGNNVLSNLRYGTRLENAMDRALHGTDPKGERNPSAKLNEEAVADIRRRLAEGELQRLIAAAHDVTQATVSKIKRGATW